MTVSYQPRSALVCCLPAMLWACVAEDGDAPGLKRSEPTASTDTESGDANAPSDSTGDTGDDPSDPAVEVASVLNTPSIDLPLFPASDLSWASVGTIAAQAASVAMDDGRIAVGALSGLYTYDGAAWTVVAENTIGAVTGVAYHEDTLVTATSSGIWTLSGDDDALALALENPNRWSWPDLDHGEAGVFVAVDGLAYRVVPDLTLLGDAEGIVGADCATQVEDRELVIYSLDEDRWVELPLPGDVSTIFEFASRAREDWVFGIDTVWHTDDAGETWSSVGQSDELSFYDVRQDGDRLLTVSGDRVGWSDDGGRTWSSTLLSSYARELDFDGDRAVVLRSSPHWSEPDPIIVVDLVAGAEAPTEALPELPPQAIRHPLRLSDGRLIVAVAEGMFAFDGTTPSYFSWLPYGSIQDVVVSVDPAMDGIWKSMIGPPWFFSSDGGYVLGGTTSGWPLRSDEAYDYHTATALAAAESGVYACTSRDVESDDPDRAVDGAGVYWLGASDAAWSLVGEGFPTVSSTDGRPASCSNIWHIDDRLFAAGGGVTVELDAEGSWQAVPGLDSIAGLVRTADGWWALTEAGLAFSTDGVEFTAPDPVTAGGTHLVAYNDTPVVLWNGRALIGGPGAWSVIHAPSRQGLAELYAVGDTLMAVTHAHELVTLLD